MFTFHVTQTTNHFKLEICSVERGVYIMTKVSFL